MTPTFTNSKRVAQSFLFALLLAFPVVSNVTATAKEPPSDWDEQIKLGVRAYETGENRAAFATFSKLMAEGSRTLGASDGHMARIYTNMGALYNEQKEYRYAEECLKRGLNIAQTGYGAGSLQSVPALIDLAQVYVNEGKDAKAQPLFKQALAIVSKPGDSDLLPYVAVIEANIGAMYFAEGNYAFGEPHLKRALEIATKSLGASHKWTVTIEGMYATCLRAEGKKKEAKAAEQAAVAKANETDSPIAIWNRQIGLADDATAAKKYTEAEAALKLALQASQAISAEPMLQAVVLTRYGQLCLLQDKPAMAIEKLKAAQTIADSVMGLEDSAVLDHAKQLADLERAHEQYADAEPLYIRLLARAKKQSGPESNEYAQALTDIAGLYNSWGQYPKAVPYYQKLLVLQEKQFGPDSDKVIPTLVALGTVAQNNTKFFSEVNETSEGYFKRAVDIATKHFGKNSKESTDVLVALSTYYQRHFDWDKATRTCNEVIKADEKNFGPNSPETVKALEHYAVVLRAAGLRNEAEPVEARIQQLKGPKNPSDD